MSECNFYSSEEIRPLFDEIVPAYQEGFKPEPWKEVSKCPDELQRCIGGFSSVAVGSLCEVCELCPSRPAYEEDELIERFDALAASRPTAWYVEQGEEGLTLAAVGWKATPSAITIEKYSDVSEMDNWLKQSFLTTGQRLKERLGIKPKEPQIMWLDEVFANRKLKPEGNLRNFGKFVIGLAEMLNVELVAYRTIEPRMIYAAERDFGTSATVFNRNEAVPDRRDFVIIDTMDVVPEFGVSFDGVGGISYRRVRKQL